MQLENLMRQAGFVEVEGRLLTLPLSGWSNGSLSRPWFPLKDMSETVTDPRNREVGMMNRDNVHRLLSSLAVYPFTEGAGYARLLADCFEGASRFVSELTSKLRMTATDVQLLAAQARLEADNQAFKVKLPRILPSSEAPCKGLASALLLKLTGLFDR